MPFPPDAVSVTIASEHGVNGCVNVAISPNARTFEIITVCVLVQPSCDVVVTVYVPASTPVNVKSDAFINPEVPLTVVPSLSVNVYCGKTLLAATFIVALSPSQSIGIVIIVAVKLLTTIGKFNI